MGLKEVLSKLRLVEIHEPSAAAPAAGRATGGAPAAGSSDGPELEELLRSLPPPKPVDEAALARRRRAPSGPQAGSTPQSAAEPSPGPDAGRGGRGGRGGSSETGSTGAIGEAPVPAVDELELPDFPSVYEAAGIPDPPHGFTAFKVLEMLQSPGLAELPPQAKASALAGFLKMNPGGPVAIGEVIQDAVRRDQALDRFEQFLQAKLAERQAAVERTNAQLQGEIDALVERHRATMAANSRAVSEHAARLSEWSAGKRVEERRLQSAVAPFVDGNPISTDSADGPSRGS